MINLRLLFTLWATSFFQMWFSSVHHMSTGFLRLVPLSHYVNLKALQLMHQKLLKEKWVIKLSIHFDNVHSLKDDWQSPFLEVRLKGKMAHLCRSTMKADNRWCISHKRCEMMWWGERIMTTYATQENDKEVFTSTPSQTDSNTFHKIFVLKYDHKVESTAVTASTQAEAQAFWAQRKYDHSLCCRRLIALSVRWL